MPACGVCANSGILGRRPFDSRGSNVDDEQQSMNMSTYTVGPMLCTEEGRKDAILCVEEHDIIDGEEATKTEFTEDCHAFDDCDFPVFTPRSSSRTEIFMDCTVGVTGEISCRPLEELSVGEITRVQTSNLQPFEGSQSSPIPTMECGQQNALTPSPSSPSKISGSNSTSATGSTYRNVGCRAVRSEAQSTLTSSFQRAGSKDSVTPTSEDTGTPKPGSPSVYGASGAEVVFASENVSVWPSRDLKIDGRLSLVKQHALLFLAWMPYSRGNINEDGTFQLLDSCTSCAHDTEKTKYTVHPIPLSDVKSITKHVPRLSWHYIVIVLSSGLTLPPLYFNKGGVRSFLSTLKEHAEPFVFKSALDPNVLLINDTPDPLQRSLNTLDLEDVLLGSLPEDAVGGLGSTGHTSISGKPISGLSQMTRATKGATASFFSPTDGQGFSGHCRGVAASVPSLPASQSAPYPQKLQCSKSVSGAPIPKPALDRRRSSSTGGIGDGSMADTEVGSFEFIDMKLNDRATRDKRPWGLPVTRERWRTFFDTEGEGRLIHMDHFREEVFYGGVEPELRKEAWKFLLGFYPSESTQEDRLLLTDDKVQEYQKIRSQWETISECQEQKFFKWRDRKKRVEKDVRRTDRIHSFFSEEEGEPLKAMRRILLTYVMYNFDLGYCQGMSDLLSPLMYVIMKDVDPSNGGKWDEAESDAFWCFSALMDKRESNFHTDQRGMHSQLLGLEKMLRLLDPQLCECFEKLDSLNFFCCFRWVLILFKREFSFDEVLRLWEALWTNHMTEYFHLYMCVAVLIDHRKEILHGVMEFDALLKFCVDLSGKIPLMHTMQLAEVLVVHGKPFEAECLGGLEALEINDS